MEEVTKALEVVTIKYAKLLEIQLDVLLEQSVSGITTDEHTTDLIKIMNQIKNLAWLRSKIGYPSLKEEIGTQFD